MQLTLSIYLPAAKSGQVHFSKPAVLKQAQSGKILDSFLMALKKKLYQQIRPQIQTQAFVTHWRLYIFLLSQFYTSWQSDT